MENELFIWLVNEKLKLIFYETGVIEGIDIASSFMSSKSANRPANLDGEADRCLRKYCGTDW